MFVLLFLVYLLGPGPFLNEYVFFYAFNMFFELLIIVVFVMIFGYFRTSQLYQANSATIL